MTQNALYYNKAFGLILIHNNVNNMFLYHLLLFLYTLLKFRK